MSCREADVWEQYIQDGVWAICDLHLRSGQEFYEILEAWIALNWHGGASGPGRLA